MHKGQAERPCTRMPFNAYAGERGNVPAKIHYVRSAHNQCSYERVLYMY